MSLTIFDRIENSNKRDTKVKNTLHWRLCNRCHIYTLVCVSKTAFLMMLCMALVVHLRFYLSAKTQITAKKEVCVKADVYEFFSKNSWKHNKLPMHESKHLVTDEDPYNVKSTACYSMNCYNFKKLRAITKCHFVYPCLKLQNIWERDLLTIWSVLNITDLRNRQNFPYNFSSHQLGFKGTRSKATEFSWKKRHQAWGRMADVLKAEAVTVNMQGPALGWGQSSMSVQTGDELIQSNPAEKGLGILVGKN